MRPIVKVAALILSVPLALFLLLNLGVSGSDDELDRVLSERVTCTWPRLHSCRPGIYFVSGPAYPTLAELMDNALRRPQQVQLWVPPSSCERDRFKLAKRDGRGWQYCLLDGFASAFDPLDATLDGPSSGRRRYGRY